MAYFDLGRYEDAEKWLNRARAMDKTKTASEYNLGRIAFEMGRYEDAAEIFDRILQKDPENVLALKAAAYTRIKTRELSRAESLYEQVLTLVPESADDGYNYALVLYALEKPEKAEEVILKYEFRLDENNDVLLLLARIQKAQNKVEAADNYAKWLQNNQDPQVRYEYAQVLEEGEFYARALEEYRTVLSALPPDPVVSSGTSGSADSAGAETQAGSATGSETQAGSATGSETRTDSASASASATGAGATAPQKGLRRSTVRYAIGRVLMLADSENEEGITELKAAVSEGFVDTEALNALLEEPKIPDSRKNSIRSLITEITAAKEAEARKEPEAKEAESEADSAESSGKTPEESNQPGQSVSPQGGS
jgi:tetratricopeptide (TPR) repeat protein